MPTAISLPIVEADCARIVPMLLVGLAGLRFYSLLERFEDDLTEDRPVEKHERLHLMIKAVEWVASYAVPIDIGKRLLEDKERIAEELLGSAPGMEVH